MLLDWNELTVMDKKKFSTYLEINSNGFSGNRTGDLAPWGTLKQHHEHQWHIKAPGIYQFDGWKM